MQFKPFAKDHAPDAARLHIQGINTGFISSLGIDFVTALYEAIAISDHAFGLVAVDSDKDKIVGFVTFCTDLNALYKSVIRKNVMKFSFILGRRLFSLARVKRIFQTLFYPSKVKDLQLPKAELLSIAVDPDARGQGLGRRLINEGFQQCRKRDIKKVKVLVAADNQPANMLYQKTGFKLHSTTKSHAVPSNIYIASTDPEKTDNQQ